MDMAREHRSERTRGIAAILVSGLLAASGAVRAEEGAIRVLLDQAKLVKLPAGTETIVIGNPAIADVTVQRGGVMVITGRSPGRTNFIAIDGAGAIISESQVAVADQATGRLVVQRGLEQSSYDCSPRCMPTVTLGDDDKHFTRAVSQSAARDGMANGSAAANGKSEKK